MSSTLSFSNYKPKMACEACAFGRGPHAEWCEVGREDKKLEALAVQATHAGNVLPLPVMTVSDCPTDKMWVMAPRKFEEIIGPDGSVTRVWEPEAEWAKRCAIIKNIGVEK